jgi:hypothetical protein
MKKLLEKYDWLLLVLVACVVLALFGWAISLPGEKATGLSSPLPFIGIGAFK